MQQEPAFSIKGLQVPLDIHAILQRNSDRHFCCYYQKNADSILNALCEKYGSDKGAIRNEGHPYPWPPHSYADFMERHFQHCREYIKNVFECGIGTNNPNLISNMSAAGRPGASLRVWRDYFFNAMIYGADIDQTILFEEDRIQTSHCDQTDPDSIARMWNRFSHIEFDLMIDDGLHTFEAGRTLLEGSFHKLKKGGLYIIEDIFLAYLLDYRSYFATRSYCYDIVLLHRKGLELRDNTMIVIRK